MQTVARIELHSADWHQYDAVHAAMSGLGFIRTIVGADEITYELPHATYLRAGDEGVDRLLPGIRAALANLGLSNVPGIVAFPAGAGIFSGLRPATTYSGGLLGQLLVGR